MFLAQAIETPRKIKVLGSGGLKGPFQAHWGSMDAHRSALKKAPPPQDYDFKRLLDAIATPLAPNEPRV